MAAPEVLAKRRHEARVNIEAALAELAPRYGVEIGRLWSNNHPGAPETNALTYVEALARVLMQVVEEAAVLRQGPLGGSPGGTPQAQRGDDGDA